MANLSRRRRRRASTTMPEITLTPLIDTALTLLIIFMVTSPMMHNAIKVDLPKGNAKEAQGIPEELVVHIDKEKTIFLNGKAITQTQLLAELKKKIGAQKNKTIFVKGDKNVNYGHVLELVDQVKGIEGVERVALATQAAHVV
jgi:biopolymer transport protein ExbD